MTFKLQFKKTKSSKWTDVRYFSHFITGKTKKPIIYKTKTKAIFDLKSSILAEKLFPKKDRVYKIRIKKLKKTKRRKK